MQHHRLSLLIPLLLLLQWPLPPFDLLPHFLSLPKSHSGLESSGISPLLKSENSRYRFLKLRLNLFIPRTLPSWPGLVLWSPRASTGLTAHNDLHFLTPLFHTLLNPPWKQTLSQFHHFLCPDMQAAKHSWENNTNTWAGGTAYSEFPRSPDCQTFKWSFFSSGVGSFIHVPFRLSLTFILFPESFSLSPSLSVDDLSSHITGNWSPSSVRPVTFPSL